MKRYLKLVVPLVVLIEVALVWSGVMELGDAVLVVAALEALLMLIGIGGVILVVKRYRRERKAGIDILGALEDGLSLALPCAVARVVTHESRIFAALFKWTFRRVRLLDNEFSYHKRSLLRSLLPMLVFVLPIELLVLHLLLYAFSPWAWLIWAVLALEIYAFFWVLGIYAALVTLPYRLEGKGLMLRYGIFAEGSIPYEEIRDVMKEERSAPSSGDGLQHDPYEESLYLATSGKTDLALVLYAPRSLRGFVKESEPAYRIYLAADEPGRLASELRRRISNVAVNSDPDRPPQASMDPAEGPTVKD